jgi:hypothetical protein
MDKLISLKDSFTPYVIIALAGDESKTELAINWGLRSAMPRLYINNWKKDSYEIICNIWDVNNKSSYSYSMIPNNTVDHVILLYDFKFHNHILKTNLNLNLEREIIDFVQTFTASFKRSPVSSFCFVKLLLKASEEHQEMLRQATDICVKNNISYEILCESKVTNMIKDVCEEIFLHRKKEFDKKLKLLLTQIKDKTTI